MVLITSKLIRVKGNFQVNNIHNSLCGNSNVKWFSFSVPSSRYKWRQFGMNEFHNLSGYHQAIVALHSVAKPHTNYAVEWEFSTTFLALALWMRKKLKVFDEKKLPVFLLDSLYHQGPKEINFLCVNKNAFRKAQAQIEWTPATAPQNQSCLVKLVKIVP